MHTTETGMDVLCIGEVLVDFSQTGPGPLGYPQYEALPGGAVANVAAALAKWGLRSGLIGHVGEDALGALLAGTLVRAGVDCARLLPSRSPTSLAMVSLDEDGERSFAFYWQGTSCSSLDRRLAEPAIWTGSRVFHFGSVSLSTAQSRDVTLASVRGARAAGAVVSFDANLRLGLWAEAPEGIRTTLLEAMGLCDLVKLSGAELGFLAGIEPAAALSRDDPRTVPAMARLRSAAGAELLFATFGREGCCWAGRRGDGRLDAPVVRAVDTTGAGDCFTAGVLYQFLALDQAPEALTAADILTLARLGVAAGALATGRRGGIPAIPALDAVQALAATLAPG
jgi:sugar/nucleoside kinase (ribokinase family)